MKRILEEVTAAHMRGPLTKFTELLANEKTGQYWLNQLVLLMRKEPTHVLTEGWLEHLSRRDTWDMAEKHFQRTKGWYNQPSWPFQICVLTIKAERRQELPETWKIAFSKQRVEDLFENIPYLPSIPAGETKRILLIRLLPRYLGFTKSFQLR